MIALRTAANPGSRIVNTHLHTALLLTSVSLWYVGSCARFPRLSDVCLYPCKWTRIFRWGVHTRQCYRLSPRPTPTASRFAICSVPALQQVEHGSLHPSVLLLSVSPTNRLMRLAKRDIQKIDHVAYETYPCGRCINTRRPLAFGHIVAHRAPGEVTGRSEWTKGKGSNRTSLESYGEVELKGIQ